MTHRNHGDGSDQRAREILALAAILAAVAKDAGQFDRSRLELDPSAQIFRSQTVFHERPLRHARLGPHSMRRWDHEVTRMLSREQWQRALCVTASRALFAWRVLIDGIAGIHRDQQIKRLRLPHLSHDQARGAHP